MRLALSEEATSPTLGPMALTPSQLETEARVRLATERGDMVAGAGLLIDLYGDELLGFLHSRLRDGTAADDCFSILAERIWTRLGQLAWHSTARAWCYALARTVMVDYVRSPDRRPDRHVDLEDAPQLQQIADAVRTRTQPYMKSEVKQAFRRLRAALSDDDQIIVMLRLDRGMGWREVAEAMQGAAHDDAALDREAARLRKRFELAKGKLRALAEAEGLLEPSR